MTNSSVVFLAAFVYIKHNGKMPMENCLAVATNALLQAQEMDEQTDPDEEVKPAPLARVQ